jgi:hypothetical protein
MRLQWDEDGPDHVASIFGIQVVKVLITPGIFTLFLSDADIAA